MQVRDVAARDHDVAHTGRAAQIVENLLVPVLLGDVKPELVDLGDVVADQIHSGAMPAVLGAGRQQLGEDLGRVSVRESLDHPHLGLVQAVARGLGVVGPVGAPIGERREHVTPHRVLPQVGQVHRVQHVRREEHRHGGSKLLILRNAGREAVGQQVAERGLELAEVLDGVLTLPGRAFPIFPAHISIAGNAGPLRLDEFASWGVGKRLAGVQTFGNVGQGFHARPRSSHGWGGDQAPVGIDVGKANI